MNWWIIILTVGTLWIGGWFLEGLFGWIERIAEDEKTGPKFIKEYKPPPKPIYQPLPEEKPKDRPNITALPEEKPLRANPNILPIPTEKPKKFTPNIIPLPNEEVKRPITTPNYQPLEEGQ